MDRNFPLALTIALTLLLIPPRVQCPCRVGGGTDPLGGDGRGELPPRPGTSFAKVMDMSCPGSGGIAADQTSLWKVDQNKVFNYDHLGRISPENLTTSHDVVELTGAGPGGAYIVESYGDIYKVELTASGVKASLFGNVALEAGEEVLDIRFTSYISEETQSERKVVSGLLRNTYNEIYFFRTGGIADATYQCLSSETLWPWSSSDPEEYRFIVRYHDNRENYYILNLNQSGMVESFYDASYGRLQLSSQYRSLGPYSLIDACPTQTGFAAIRNESTSLAINTYDFGGSLVGTSPLFERTGGDVALVNFIGYYAVMQGSGVEIFDYDGQGSLSFTGLDPVVIPETRDEVLVQNVFTEGIVGWGYTISTSSIYADTAAFRFNYEDPDVRVQLNIGQYVKNHTSATLYFVAHKGPNTLNGSRLFKLDDDDPTGPLITNITYEPIPEFLNKQYVLEIEATISDPESGVKNASIFYQFEGGIQYHEMTPTPGKLGRYNATINPWALIGMNVTAVGVEAVNLDWDVMFEGDRDYSSVAGVLSISVNSPLNIVMERPTVFLEQRVLRFTSSVVDGDWSDVEVDFLGVYFKDLNKLVKFSADPKGNLMSGMVDLYDAFNESFPLGFHDSSFMVLYKKWGLQYVSAIETPIYFTDVQFTWIRLVEYALLVGICVSLVPVNSYLIASLRKHIDKKRSLREFNRDVKLVSG
ncbi:MAG: hypothetical protein ACTSU5_02770 [Promethearchaeota archaeon]